MKIAICVSGQLRGAWRDCIPTWGNMFNENEEVDYFVHTWTNKTAPNAIAHANKDSEDEVIDNQEINELKRLLKPKKILVEDPIDFANRTPDQHEWAVFDPNYHSQFYGVMMACHLKQQHEYEFAQQYDLCVRMRFDNFVQGEYKLTPVKMGNVNVIHQTFDSHQHHYRCSDVYWSAPSFDYDRICDFFSCIPKYKRSWFDAGNDVSYGPEHVLSFHIKANHIKPNQTYMPVKLKREEKHYSGGAHEIT